MPFPSFKKDPEKPDLLIQRMVSPLIASRYTGEETVLGTAFLIGRGYAMTAFHVIEEYLSIYDGSTSIDGFLNATFELRMTFFSEDLAQLVPMKAVRTWNAPPLDIVIMALVVPEDQADGFNWAVPRLSLRPPKVGEVVAAFGFPSSEVTHCTETAAVTVTIHHATSVGIVQELHHEQRDQYRLPFPCFRLNAQFDGGMSGGPIFDSSGNVCGVVCSNLPPSEEGEEHVSYGSTLWPIVATHVSNIAEKENTEYYPFHQLLENKTVIAVDMDAVSLRTDANGRPQPMVAYDQAEWDGTAI